MVLQKLLRAGEGKTVRRLKGIADHIETLEEDYVDLSGNSLDLSAGSEASQDLQTLQDRGVRLDSDME